MKRSFPPSQTLFVTSNGEDHGGDIGYLGSISVYWCGSQSSSTAENTSAILWGRPTTPGQEAQ